MNIEDLIKKYESLEGVWNANGAEIARHCFLRDLKKLNAIDTKKVTVPQYVADWYEEHKDNLEYNIWDWMKYNLEPKKRENVIFSKWLGKTVNNPVETLIKMKLYGYEVEEEKRYYVRFKFIEDSYSYLTLIKHLNAWTLTEIKIDKKFRTEHTKKQLEEANFGWVFDCPGIEIEEAEE